VPGPSQLPVGCFTGKQLQVAENLVVRPLFRGSHSPLAGSFLFEWNGKDSAVQPREAVTFLEFDSRVRCLLLLGAPRLAQEQLVLPLSWYISRIDAYRAEDAYTRVVETPADFLLPLRRVQSSRATPTSDETQSAPCFPCPGSRSTAAWP